MVIFIGSYHAALGLVALLAYVTVGILIPVMTSRRSGDAGICFRTKSGMLSDFVLDSLRGLSEIIQYGQGERRLEEMDCPDRTAFRGGRTCKRTAGKNVAVTNTAILLFDLAMLFLSAKLVGFEGCLIVTLAMMSSFGAGGFAVLSGSNFAEYVCGRKPGLDILEEHPVVEEITGKENLTFHGPKQKTSPRLWRGKDFKRLFRGDS